MEQYNEELKAHLTETDEHFRSLVAQHALFERRLDEIKSKSPLSPQDEQEEMRLKKQKLRIKDEMISIINRHRAEQPA